MNLNIVGQGMWSSVCHNHHKSLISHSARYTQLVCYLHMDFSLIVKLILKVNFFLKAACVIHCRLIKLKDIWPTLPLQAELNL